MTGNKITLVVQVSSTEGIEDLITTLDQVKTDIQGGSEKGNITGPSVECEWHIETYE